MYIPFQICQSVAAKLRTPRIESYSVSALNQQQQIGVQDGAEPTTQFCKARATIFFDNFVFDVAANSRLGEVCGVNIALTIDAMIGGMVV